MRINLGVAALLGVCALPALGQQQRWVNINPESDQPVWLDTQSARAEGPIRVIWIRLDFIKPQHELASGDELAFSYTEYKAKDAIDCATRRMKALTMVFYDSSGKVVHSYPETGYAEWKDPVPESIGESIIAGVCKYYPMK